MFNNFQNILKLVFIQINLSIKLVLARTNFKLILYHPNFSPSILFLPTTFFSLCTNLFFLIELVNCRPFHPPSSATNLLIATVGCRQLSPRLPPIAIVGCHQLSPVVAIYPHSSLSAIGRQLSPTVATICLLKHKIVLIRCILLNEKMSQIGFLRCQTKQCLTKNLFIFIHVNITDSTLYHINLIFQVVKHPL